MTRKLSAASPASRPNSADPATTKWRRRSLVRVRRPAWAATAPQGQKSLTSS